MAKFNPFKKKEPVYKNVPEDASWFKKMWHQKKGRAILKLGLWGVFMVGVILFVAIGNRTIVPKAEEQKRQEEKKQNQNDIETMQSVIRNANYDYDFKIIDGTNITTFSGKKTSTENSGYKDVNGTVYKYVIKASIPYKVENNQEIPLDNLYEGINNDFIDLEYIFTLLWPKEFTRVEEDNKITFDYEEFILKEKTIKAEIITSSESQNKIVINEDNVVYELSYVILD